MKSPDGVIWAIVVLISVQSHPEVESFTVEAAIGVVSGVMGIIDFIIGRYESLTETQANTIERAIERLDMKAQLTLKLDEIHNAIKDLGRQQEFSDSMNSLRESSILIHDNYQNMLEAMRFLRNDSIKDDYPRARYGPHAREIRSRFSVENPLRKIHIIIGNLFRNLSIHGPFIKQYEEHFNVCVTHMSPLQAVSKLLEQIVWISSDYYNTRMISDRIIDKLDGTNTTEDFKRAHQKEIFGWYNETITTIESELWNLSREVHACGLPDLSKEEQFQEMKVFTEFFLRKCVNEHLKPPRCSAINETQVCDELDSSKHLDRVCALSQPCGRSMYDCTDSNDLDVCINNISIDQRYYYYHKSGEAGEYDGDKECQVQNLGEVSRSEVHTPLFGNRGNIIPFLCGSCKCVCEEEMYYINQAGAYADAKNDMVVTGAKFILRNNILEIHIQQGKLLPFGVIYVPPGGADSLEWIGPQKEDLEPISWEGARRILLSTEIETAVGEAVIGLNLKYGKLEHWSEKAIYLEVRTADLDLKEGRVSGPFKEWFPLTFPERELNFTNAESPRHPPEFSNVTTETGATFRFTTSGGKDGGRGTIPYIDLRKVTSATPTPMSGAALQWRGIGGTGGFLGISLSTYNIVSFITDNKRSPSRMQQRDIQDQESPM